MLPEAESEVVTAQPAEILHGKEDLELAKGAPLAVVKPEEDPPSDVKTAEALEVVPKMYLSEDPKRPLLFVDTHGDVYTYLLKPWRCVVLILLMELLERLSYYGINFTQTAYLTGSYGDWSPHLTSTEASSWVLTSTAVAYSVPFLGAILSDGFLGNYKTILLFSTLVYIPGLLIIALCTKESIFGDAASYPTSLLAAGLLGLYPIGAGGIKACVNVMGAQQFHPVLQKSQVSKYYVWFYMFINVGALVGGIAIPIIIQSNVFAAYIIPVVGLSLGVAVFVLGTPQYVRVKPQGSDILESLMALAASFGQCPPSLERTKKSQGGMYDDIFIEKVKVIGRLVPIMLAVVPFNMAYGQMSNVFVIQGTVMQPAGFIDASWMQNFDAFSVLLSGFVLGTFVFPWLERMGRTPHMHTKFAIGSALGALALIADVIIDYEIHAVYASSGEKISLLWQVFPFFFIGMGEIFAISSAYDAAFKLSPVGMKSFGSALNLFMIGAVPNFISEAILNACTVWFSTASGSTDLSTIEAYSQAQVYNYLWVLVGIALLGVVVNLLPQLQVFYSKTEEKSAAITAASARS